MAGKHLFRINGYERPRAARQNFTFGIADFCHVDVAASVQALLCAGDSKRLAQRDRLKVFDFHGRSERQHIAEFVHLAHGFVQDGSDDAAVRVARRASVFARQLEMANGLPRFFVQ